MFEILSFVFGGLFRLAPKLMEMREKEKDREHERSMLTLQMQADAQRANANLQAIEKQADARMQIEELRAIVEANKAQAQPKKLTGMWFLDALITLSDVASNFVRPALTYWYCVIAYGSYKVALYWLIMSQGSTWEKAILQLWTPNDHAVMFSIIGFWFVDRAIRKREGV